MPQTTTASEGKVCARLIMQEKIESFVIERIKADLLTEDNLRELVKLTNEEISQAKEEYEDRLGVIEGQLADLREKLPKLYDALETGQLDREDLAPISPQPELHRRAKVLLPLLREANRRKPAAGGHQLPYAP